MQRASSPCEPQQQAAWSILVVWVVFDDSRLYAGLPNFKLADISLDSSLERMAAELKLAKEQLRANFVNGFHSNQDRSVPRKTADSSQFPLESAVEHGLKELSNWLREAA